MKNKNKVLELLWNNVYYKVNPLVATKYFDWKNF